ncbi:MAG: 2-amino-4-hydroxy-6-hydroxymethyldihydropteridine diphosphokinase [Pirellulaceae bacterium]
MASCLIALGSNLGDSLSLINQASEAIEQFPGVQQVATSSILETAAVGGPADQSAFLNSALLLDTTLSAGQLFKKVRLLENQLGRQRDVRWGPRTMDLDLLLYDNLVIRTSDLELPHPRMTFRNFVLEPACQVACSFRHPVNGATLAELHRHLLTSANYMAVTGPGSTVLAERLAERSGGQLASGRPGRDDHFPDSLERALQLDPAGWVFSDGWVDELLCPPGDATSLAHWSDQRELIPPAKIVVAIEPCRLDQQSAWRRIIERPHRLPVLALPEGDLDGQIEETLAAIAAAGNLSGAGK